MLAFTMPQLVKVLKGPNYIENGVYSSIGYRTGLMYDFLYSLALSLSGIGLLLLKKWAKYLALILAALTLFTNMRDLINYFSLSQQGQSEQLWGIFFYLGIVYAIITLIYFSNKKVSLQFDK